MNGFSYKNVYNSENHKALMDSKRYVIDDKFFYQTGIWELSDGFLVEYTIYSDDGRTENYSYTKAVATKAILRNSGKKVYEYYCFNSYAYGFKDIIHHKNGHRYYPFHVDMYGISFLDVDTMEVYNYIPDGYKHNDDRMCGESFLIYNVHYDIKSNLIAYYGTYLGMAYDIMVGDFSDPLNFNSHLVSFSDAFNNKYDVCYDEISFKEWKNNRLYVLYYDDHKEKSLSADELRSMIDELTERENL